MKKPYGSDFQNFPGLANFRENSEEKNTKKGTFFSKKRKSLNRGTLKETHPKKVECPPGSKSNSKMQLKETPHFRIFLLPPNYEHAYITCSWK